MVKFAEGEKRNDTTPTKRREACWRGRQQGQMPNCALVTLQSTEAGRNIYGEICRRRNEKPVGEEANKGIYGDSEPYYPAP
jgi:hypothetical protein